MKTPPRPVEAIAGSTLVACTIAGAWLLPSVAGSKSWLEEREAVERVLRAGEVIEDEEISWGVTKPRKLVLDLDGRRLSGIWKPIEKGRSNGAWESHQAEVAAYELDKLLGLDMVPPTFIRELRGQKGSVQLWMEEARMFAEVVSKEPPEKKWHREVSRMELFDNLICNRDRNARNFLVTPDWHIVLIDHSQAFTTRSPFFRDGSLCLATNGESVELPEKFDRLLVESIRQLDIGTLNSALGSLLTTNQIESVLERRDALMLYIEQLVEAKGAKAVWL
jgi:hypothetical protein